MIVRLIGRYLDGADPPLTLVVPDLADCLSQFVRLIDRPTSAIAAFANKYGALELCDAH